MYPRTNYEMSEADLNDILDACKPVPAMMIGGVSPSSPQENANRAWAALGKKIGFDHTTVRPIPGKGNRFFSAVPSEPESVRAERLEREAAEARVREMADIEAELERLQARLALLASGIEGEDGDPQGLHPEGESPVPKPDAQASAPTPQLHPGERP